MLHPGEVDLAGRLDRRSGVLDGLFVVLRLQKLLGLDELGLGSRDIERQPGWSIALRPLYCLRRFVDLGQSLGGQADIFLGQLFGPVQVGRGVSELLEQTNGFTARLRHFQGDPVENLGGGLVVLVGRQAVFLVAGEQGINATGRVADLFESASELLGGS